MCFLREIEITVFNFLNLISERDRPFSFLSFISERDIERPFQFSIRVEFLRER